MNNVAHAYILTQPGNAIVYYNAKEFGTGRDFPVDGRGDAIGNYGDTITELVNIRNTHGRGDYRQRWLENSYFAMERSESMLVLLDNRNDSGDLGLQDHGYRLSTEHTARGADRETRPRNADSIQVDDGQVPAGSKVNVQVPAQRRAGQRLSHLRRAEPEVGGGRVVTNASSTLAGGPIDSGNVFTTARRGSPTCRWSPRTRSTFVLDTQAVTLPGGFRDVDADGDNAVLRVNNGVDTNGNGHIDYTTPGSVVYGFEEFNAGEKSPGFGSATGNGWYREIDQCDRVAGGLQLHHGAGVSASGRRRAGGVLRFQEGCLSGSRSAARCGRELCTASGDSQQSEQSRYDRSLGRWNGQQHALLPRSASDDVEQHDPGNGRGGQPGNVLRPRLLSGLIAA